MDPEPLIERLASDDEAWRADAERRLVALGAEAVAPLRRALSHPSPAVRLHAVRALAKLRAAEALPDVVRALGDLENHGAVAIAAEKALVEWGAPAVPAVLEVALSGQERVRPRALRALGRMGGEQLAPPLAGLLRDPSAPVRAQAAAALASAVGPRAAPLLAALLGDADKWVRYEAAEALVHLGSARGRRVLEQAREDPEEQEGWVPGWAQDLLDELDERIRTGRGIDEAEPHF